MARDLKAKVRLEADTRQASQAIERLRTLIDRALGELSDVSASVGVDVDTSELEALSSELAELEGAQATAQANVEADTGELEEAASELDDFDGATATAEATVEADASQLDEASGALDDFDGQSVQAEATVEADTSDLDVAAVALDDFDGSTAAAEVTIDADTAGLDVAAVALGEFDGQQATAEAVVEADTSGVDAAASALDDIDGATASASVDVDASQALSGLDEAEVALSAIDGATATATVDADASGAISEIEEAQDRLDSFDGQTATASVEIEGGDTQGLEATDLALGGVAASALKVGPAAIAAGAGLTALAAAGVAAARAAAEQESAISFLEGSLAELGDTLPEVSQSLQEYAASLQRVSTFGDEEIIRAQAIIAAFAKEEEQIKSLTAATLDFAQAKQVDLAIAADLIAKTFGSSTNALTRYGIEVDGAANSLERAISIADGIEKVFGGQALKAIETSAGAWAQLSNSIGDTFEQIGRIATENEAAIGAVRSLSDQLGGLNAELEDLSEGEAALLLIQRFTGALAQGAPLSREYAEALDDTTEALVRASFGYGPLTKEQEAQIPLLAQITQRLIEQQKAYGPLTQAQQAQIVANAKIIASQRSLNEIYKEGTEFLRAYNAELVPDTVDELKNSLRELGVTIESDVNASIAKNNVLLEAAEVAYRNGAISLATLIDTENTVAEANRKLTESLEGQVEAFNDSGEASTSYGTVLDVTRGQVEALTLAERRQIEQAEENAARRQAIAAQDSELTENLLGGTSSFVTIGGGTFAGPPDQLVVGRNGRVTLVGGSLYGSGPQGTNAAG